jgi:hypothetical protein
VFLQSACRAGQKCLAQFESALVSRIPDLPVELQQVAYAGKVLNRQGYDLCRTLFRHRLEGHIGPKRQFNHPRDFIDVSKSQSLHLSDHARPGKRKNGALIVPGLPEDAVENLIWRRPHGIIERVQREYLAEAGKAARSDDCPRPVYQCR